MRSDQVFDLSVGNATTFMGASRQRNPRQLIILSQCITPYRAKALTVAWRSILLPALGRPGPIRRRVETHPPQRAQARD
jgi:hypothetical protein